MNDGSVMIENAGNTDWNIEITDNNNSVLVSNSSNSNTNNFGSLLPGNYSVSVESKGIIDEFGFTINPAVNLTSDFILIQDTIYINNGGNINIINNSQNAMSYYWDFDDGNSSNNLNPTYAYSSIGNYNITLYSDNNNCTSSSTKQITVLQSQNIATAITELDSEHIKLSNLGYGNYQLKTLDHSAKQILVLSMDGKMVHNDIFYSINYNLNLNNYSSGIYILRIISEDQSVFSEKLIN
jgi:PKD repeat protein